ncbi:coiled-coil domain-containing protein [Streptomyces sp. NPDC096198]|uniref:coiled-coil domain-containing protein n=1 Tax=Streptomyces sp. NPDC096198 TaxID=3366080 RepID=UPI0037F4AA0F
MSERLLRRALTAAVTASALLAPVPPAAGAPEPSPRSPSRTPEQPPRAPSPGPALQDSPSPGPSSPALPAAPSGPPLSDLLTELRERYRQAEEASATYDTVAAQLKKRQAEVARLDGQLARTRQALDRSRRAVGLLARQQYRSSMEIGSYVRLLMAQDPQHALDLGHVLARLGRERAGTARRLAAAERHADALARAARTALDGQLALTERQRKQRDDVRQRLKDIDSMLAALSPDQLAALSEYERGWTESAQQKLLSSGAYGPSPAPVPETGRPPGTRAPGTDRPSPDRSSALSPDPSSAPEAGGEPGGTHPHRSFPLR